MKPAAKKALAKASPAETKKKTQKQVIRKPAAAGWTVETRVRPTGQTDRYYLSPGGDSYRLRHEAIANGYPESE